MNRKAAGGVAETVIRRYRARERLYVVITPEGTRKKVTRWKSGFHRIARGAGVPVVPVLFDWSQRDVRVEPPVEMGEELEADRAPAGQGPPADGAPPRAVLGRLNHKSHGQRRQAVAA